MAVVVAGAVASAARARLSAVLAVSAFAVEIVAGAGDDASLSTTMRRPPRVAEVVITMPAPVPSNSSERNPAKSPAARGMAAAVGCAAVRGLGAGRALLAVSFAKGRVVVVVARGAREAREGRRGGVLDPKSPTVMAGALDSVASELRS